MELPRRGLPARKIGGTARISSVLWSIDQGIRYEVQVVSDDDEGTLPSTPPPPSSAGGTSSQVSYTEAVNQPGREGQVNKSARKRKRKLGARDESKLIVSAITNFSKEILEIEKRKLKLMDKLMDKLIDHEKEGWEMMLKGQVQMAAIILEALKAKDSSSSSQ